MDLRPSPLRQKAILAILASVALLTAGCGPSPSGDGARSGIPVSELPTKRSSLDPSLIAAAVKTQFPAERYMTNEFLPNRGDYARYVENPLETPQTLRVGMPWIASDGFSPLYLGIEKGFFAAVGLEVVMVPGGPGRDHLQTLVGEQVDVAITADGMNLPVFAASRTSGDIVGVASFLKKNPVAYLSLDASVDPSERTQKEVVIEDFAGSTIGVLRGRTHYVEFLVDHFGLDPEQVRVRWTGSTPDALITGVVDHWAAWILDQPRMLEKNGFRNWKPFFFHDLGWKQYCDIVVVRRETAAAQPDKIRRFLAALDQAVQFYFDAPEEAAEITSRYATDVSYTAADVARRFAVERELVIGDDGLPLLHMDPNRWNDVVTLLVQYGLIEETILQ